MLLIVFLIVIIVRYLFFGNSLAVFNTVYTKDFSYSKLGTVKTGMNKNDIKNILGEPFYVWKPGDECWVYSKQKDWYFNELLTYVSARVCFGLDEHVSWVGSNTF